LIRSSPDRETFAMLRAHAGFVPMEQRNLFAGITADHVGVHLLLPIADARGSSQPATEPAGIVAAARRASLVDSGGGEASIAVVRNRRHGVARGLGAPWRRSAGAT